MSSTVKADSTGKSKTKSLRTKQSTSSNAPKLKVVIRRLPPNLPENIFWQSVAQWVTDETSNWKLYVPGKLRTKLNRENTPSRAYVEFVTPEAVITFNRDYNGHVFRDKQGNESSVVVEYAPYQKVPHEKRKADAKAGTIEADEDFISFLEALNKPAEPTPDVNELTTQSVTATAEPTSTPLLDALKAAKEANTIKGYHSHYRDQPAQSRHRVHDLEDAETFSRRVPVKNQHDSASSEAKDVERGKEKEKDREGGGKRGKNKQKEKEKASGAGPGPKSPKPAAAIANTQSTAPSRAESSRARPPAGAGINARVLAALGSGNPSGRKGSKQREPSGSGVPANESTPASASTSVPVPASTAAASAPAAPLPAGVIAIPGAIKPPETPKKSRGGRNRGRGGGGGGASAKEGGGSAPTTLSDMPRIDDPGQALPPVASTQRGRGGGGGSGRGRGGRGRGGRGRGGGGGGESAPSAGQVQ